VPCSSCSVATWRNPDLDKKDLTEQEIRTRYITPAIQPASWLPRQIREEVYLTDGQIHPRGRVAPRGRRKYADYVLYHHNLPLAIVEAKDNSHPFGSRMPEATEYAAMCGALAEEVQLRLLAAVLRGE
jgi:type I restriction enzyme R subunit